MASFGRRVVGAMRLNAATFEDVEHDRRANTQAALVVTAAAVAAALVPVARGYGSSVGVGTAVLFGLIGWLIGSFVLLVVGTRLFPETNTEADMGQLLRTCGFAQAPGLVAVLGATPLVGGLIILLTRVWILAALVVAVRQALDYTETSRAVIVCVVAWLAMFLVTVLGAIAGFGLPTTGVI